MKQKLLIIFLFFSALTYAQEYSRVSFGNRNDIGGAPNLLVEDSVVFSFTVMDGNPRAYIYRKFNRSGLLLDSAYYDVDTPITLAGLRANSLRRVSNMRLVMLHDLFSSNSDVYTKIYLINNSLDTIASALFKIPNTPSTLSFAVLVEDTAITILGHYALPNNKLSLYIARFDTALNLQWYSTIDDFKPFANQYYNGYYPYRLRRVGNHYYIAGRCLYTTQSVEGFLVKTDLAGNKIWDKRYKYQNKNGVDVDVVSIGNDSLFSPHYFLSKEINNTPYGKAYLRMMDTSGAIIRDTVYPDEEPYFQMWQLAFLDDAIFLVGDFYQGGQKSFVWKLDKNLNTLWRKVYFYGDYEDDSYLYNVGQWSDGGIIANGVYIDRYLNPTPKNGYLWLLSLDANGCLDANNCGSDIGFVEWALPGQGIKLYPNPATDFINIELSLPNLQNTTATVRLFNLAGQEVLRQEVQFEGGKAHVNLHENSSLPLGEGWGGVLQLKTETHLFVEKIMVE